MTCWFCGAKMIWGGDHSFEDYGIEGDGIVANLSCSKCGATAEFYTKMEDDDMAKVIVDFYKDKSKKWRFRFIASNGRILASSEAYSSKAKAMQGQKAITEASQFIVKVDG